MPRFLSPTFAASIGLAILAFAAPGHAHADALAPIAAEKVPFPPIDEVIPESTPPDPTPPEPTPEPYHREGSRWDKARAFAAIGVRFGNFTINGDSSGTAIPFHIDAGVRRSRWVVFASYDVLGVSADVPAPDDPARTTSSVPTGDGSGLAHRLGATARYSVGRFGETDGGLELWTEGGIGVQHLRWDAGGTLTRPDVGFGVGMTVIYLGREHHTGGTIGLHVMLSPRNDTSNTAPACGGPCDTATPPSSLDRGFLFDITLPFGT
jgi:hypothetical protein